MRQLLHSARAGTRVPHMALVHQLLGILVLLGLALALSEQRRAIRWRTVFAALGLALLLAAAALKLPPLAAALQSFNSVVAMLSRATQAGTAFVFGYLGGAPPPFAEVDPNAGFVLAFRALPLVLVISALSALLFHWRILPRIVLGFAWLLRRALGIGGAVGVAAAANVFVGMVEAPLVVRPYLARLSRGELFMVMTGGMATIAGTVLVLYAIVLAPVVPDALTHLLTASMVATPLAIAVSALLVPSASTDDGKIVLPREDANAIAALTRGTLEGMQLLLAIVAMLLVFVALVSLLNMLLALAPSVAGSALTLERLLGWLFAPLAWLIGVPLSESTTAGALLGKKVALNEFLAYLDLAALPESKLSPRSRLLLIYAMCGFANFGSLGIMLGGLATMLPQERRVELSQLGMKSVAAGLLSTCLSAAIVGLFI
jgi:CNT family concentrative nucleoside transporter